MLRAFGHVLVRNGRDALVASGPSARRCAGGSQLVVTGRGRGRNELRPSRFALADDLVEFPSIFTTEHTEAAARHTEGTELQISQIRLCVLCRP